MALITGGGAGLGRAVAEVLGQAGYRILIADVDTGAGSAAADAMSGAGIAACFVRTDVADPDQAAGAVSAAVTQWGRLDFVLNNAGIAGRGATIEDLDEADLARVIAVDLLGPFHVCKAAVRAMKGHGGAILNVASITAFTGSAYYPAYSAAKAGVIALTRSIARKTGRLNIRVNCLNPGSISGTGLMRVSRGGRELTPEEKREEAIGLMKQIPLGRPARPQDIAQFVLFLASPLAAHIHGAVLTIDGGESLGYH
ncbi:MAG TPA: SDR family NAD(P)-dependent oxidoreductase [Thermoanaerobaculia bacterium]